MTILLRCIVLVTGLSATGLCCAGDPGHIQLASVNAAITDLESGKRLYSKHADQSVPIASITKLMTAMVVIDSQQPLDQQLEIRGWDAKLKKNAYSRIRVGSESSRAQLLKIALMSSENLASHTLARYHPGGIDAFVEDMNRKAAELGMTRSIFVDPTGLAVENQASAGDLSKLVAAAFDSEIIRAYTTTYQYTARFHKPRYSLGYGNTNPLTASSRWDVALSKTGYLNEAGRCLVVVTNIDEQPISMVLLNSFGSRTPLGDAGRVRRWIKTGASGSVAGAALEYERRMTQAYGEQADD